MADSILEHLYCIRDAVDAVRNDMSEVKNLLGMIESRHANISHQIDCLDNRVERIERALG